MDTIGKVINEKEKLTERRDRSTKPANKRVELGRVHVGKKDHWLGWGMTSQDFVAETAHKLHPWALFHYLEEQSMGVCPPKETRHEGWEVGWSLQALRLHVGRERSLL